MSCDLEIFAHSKAERGGAVTTEIKLVSLLAYFTNPVQLLVQLSICTNVLVLLLPATVFLLSILFPMAIHCLGPFDFEFIYVA